VSNQEDSANLQKGFCALKEWSDYWLLKLNVKKCDVISLCYRNAIIKYKYSATVDSAIIDLERCNNVRDLGVIVHSKLSFSDHMTEKLNKVYSIFGRIKRNFQHVDEDAFVLLYKALVRSDWATVCKTVRPMLSVRCLSVCLSVTLVYCGQTVGWIKMKLGMQVASALATLCKVGTQLPLP